MNMKEMEKLLHTEIPISRTMEVSVTELSSTMLRLALPLKPNHNHKGTLFGGSSYAACALACYGLFLSGLIENGINTKNVVVGEGNIRYLEPIEKDCIVEASWALADSQKEFFDNLARWKKSRTEMQAHIRVDGKLCAEFSAQFIAKT